MRIAVVLLCVFVLTGCGGRNTPRVVIETDAGEVTVAVEVADSPAERAVGLMHRPSLDADAGMIFVFAGERRGGFWMKDTLIPLSVGFANRDGQILSILDMEPCPADPCRVYDPGMTYATALEVNRGAFARWGVRAGDRLRLER